MLGKHESTINDSYYYLFLHIILLFNPEGWRSGNADRTAHRKVSADSEEAGPGVQSCSRLCEVHASATTLTHARAASCYLPFPLHAKQRKRQKKASLKIEGYPVSVSRRFMVFLE